jgi:hypothetical protein
MEKAGHALGSKNLEERGQEKREKKGYNDDEY